MFKNIDKKFEEIGFIKTEENEYQVIYKRENEFFKFTQVLANGSVLRLCGSYLL